jgi:hypothetical protein
VKILVCYIAVTQGKLTQGYASRFVGTYLRFGAGIEHDTMIICNGGPLSNEVGCLFAPLNCKMFPRSNEGFDLGGYIEATGLTDADMMVCLGESVYFHRPGWLARMVEAWKKHGPGMYGFWSSNLIRPHMNTTGFVIAPFLLRGWSYPVKTRDERYNFEHGERSFWRHVERLGWPVKFVTWDGEYGPREWRAPQNILWTGDQSNLLAWCLHTDKYREADGFTKPRWERNANMAFK